MQTQASIPNPTSTSGVSKKAFWTGWVLAILPAGLLIFSAVMKLAKPAPVLEGFAKFGFGENLISPLGIVELTCALIYLIPRTSVLGAILLTGYLGGATCTNVRVGEPWFPTVILGIVIWGGLFLRYPKLRALIPWLTK